MILRLIQGFDGSTAGFIILVLSQIKPFVEIFHVICIASPRHDWKKMFTGTPSTIQTKSHINCSCSILLISRWFKKRMQQNARYFSFKPYNMQFLIFIYLFFLFHFNLRNFYLLGAILNPNKKRCKKNKAPRPGIEPRSPAWQSGILTTILTRRTESI